jgi:integrase
MSYETGLQRFFKIIYPESKENLDILSERYLAENRDHREDILDFKDSLKGYAPKTIGSRLNAVRTFLEENEINFPKRFFKKINGKVSGTITEERIPSNEELRRIIEYLPVQGKALALVLSSSGMRIGEALQIKIKDIDLTRNPVKIKIRAEYTKTGKKRITFISPEAKLVVKEWLSYRDQYKERADGRSWEHEREDNDQLFPFTHYTFNYMWHNALGKAQLLERDEKTNRVTLRPHNLRKFFRLRVGRYGRDEAEALMGHQKGLDRIYADFGSAEGRLEKVYRDSIPDLSVYGRTSGITDESIKEELKKNEDTIDTLIKDGYVKDKKIEYLTREIKQVDEKTKEKIRTLEKNISEKSFQITKLVTNSNQRELEKKNILEKIERLNLQIDTIGSTLKWFLDQHNKDHPEEVEAYREHVKILMSMQ